MAETGHRSCIALRGTREETCAQALAVVARLDPAEVLWVGLGAEPGVAMLQTAPRAVVGLLGRAFDAVVMDVHAGLDPDVLGQCHGFVRGGGALVLRMPPLGELPVDANVALAAFPFREQDVARHFHERFERVLAAVPAGLADAVGDQVIAPPYHPLLGTDEQAAVVARLYEVLARPEPACAVLLADRGRGKSAALGLALGRLSEQRSVAGEPRQLLGAQSNGVRVALSASHEVSLNEVLRFAPNVVPVPLHELIEAAPDSYDVIVIDEAAQIPVPVLRLLTRRQGRARIAFASTVRGYEGTGRGFVLRFLAWLASEPRPVHHLSLATPIRWRRDDALERFVFDALLLDAEPVAALPNGDRYHAENIDRARLAHDEADLRALFGLLVHAHYRTTPGDLRRLLDAPNLALHALRDGVGHIVAACLVAFEGGLSEALCDDLYAGRGRIRAHALADALVSHLGYRDAGRLTMVRSVRIAVHPGLRRVGLARRLVEHVHASYSPDLFGTLFGATPELIGFRRDVGYHLVRVSASRGARTGEPSVMMLRPVSEAANDLVQRLRAELVRDLPVQLELLTADRELLLDPELEAALTADETPAAPLPEEELRRLVQAYAAGPRTLESVALAIDTFVAAHRETVERLPREQRALIDGRVTRRLSWSRVARDAGFANAGIAMRAMRRAIRALLAATSGDEAT